MDVQHRVILPYITNLPRDVAINDWCVHLGTPGNLATTITAIKNFYISQVVDGAGGHTLGYFLSNEFTRATNGCRIETYTISNPASPVLGAPTVITPFTLSGAASSTQDMPSEVALCTSFASNTGTSPGRRKGRIFVGPFNSTWSGLRPPTAAVNGLSAITNGLQTALLSADANLAVWSRADAAIHGVLRGWVDNEWDTQRRRGLEATSRNSWTNP